MFLRAPEAVVQQMCQLGKEPQGWQCVGSVRWGRKDEQLCFPFYPSFQAWVLLSSELLPLSPYLSPQPCGWGARTALSPQKMLRQEVRQFVYWQISAETHEPHKHRCSVPCYIRMVTIPLGKVQKINKQAKLVLTYPGEGCEQSLVQVRFSSIQLEWKTCDTSSGNPLGEL